MLYRIFLYRAVTLPGFAPPTGLINAALRMGERDVWQGAAPLLEGFDAPAVRRRIQDALADPAAETGKGHPLVKLPPQPFAQTPYIYVATSSARAIEVLPCLYTIALENDLVMYDAETDRAFYSGSALGADDAVDRGYITMLNRHLALCRAIREETPLLFSLRWLGTHFEAGNSDCAFVVTLRKDKQRSFAQRNEDFYALLTQHLVRGEKLRGKDLCYVIRGPGYTIRFTLEGYKKDADRIGCIRNGRPYVTLLHRMGTEKAYRWAKTHLQFDALEVQNLQWWMSVDWMRRDYPNPGQRFVESVMVSKWNRKYALDSGRLLPGSRRYEAPKAVAGSVDADLLTSAPTLCDETIYADAHCRVRRIWTWSIQNLWEHSKTGILKATLADWGYYSGGKYTFVSPDGKRQTDQVFDWVSSFNDGHIVVGIRGKGMGYLDWQLRTVIPPQFDEARQFQEGRAAVRKGERWFFIDCSGQELPNALPADKRCYRNVGDFCDGMARVSTRNVDLWSEYEFDFFARAGISGYIDKTGKEIATPQYILAQDFAHGIALAAKGRWVPCHPRYDDLNPGYYGGAERWGALDRTGTEVIPFVFNEIYCIEESLGYYAVLDHHGFDNGWNIGLWGIMDRSGRWVAPPVFAHIGDCSGDLVAFAADRYNEDPRTDSISYGIYDLAQKKVLFEPQFYSIRFLADGGIKVGMYDEALGRCVEKIIDRSGKERFPSVYTEIWPGPDDLYDVVISNGEEEKFGLIDRDGRTLLPCVFSLPVRDAWLKHEPVPFTENGGKGLMDLSGSILLPAVYDDVTVLDVPLVLAWDSREEPPVASLHLLTGETVLRSACELVGWCKDGRHFYCCRPGLCEMYEYEPLT